MGLVLTELVGEGVFTPTPISRAPTFTDTPLLPCWVVVGVTGRPSINTRMGVLGVINPGLVGTGDDKIGARVGTAGRGKILLFGKIGAEGVVTVGVTVGAVRDDELEDDEPDEPPGIVITYDTVEPVPIRFVAPTDTVTRAPAVRPLSVQNVSVAFTNVHERFTEYALMLSPPSSAGAVHDANAVVFDSDDTTRPVGASGTVAGTPNAVAVFEDSAVEFTEVIATIFTSYAVPLVNPVKV